MALESRFSPGSALRSKAERVFVETNTHETSNDVFRWSPIVITLTFNSLVLQTNRIRCHGRIKGREKMLHALCSILAEARVKTHPPNPAHSGVEKRERLKQG